MPIARDLRPIIQRAEWGLLRQGVIFTGASADGYSGCEAVGLVVTARCDVAHDKAPIINFVPIVRLSDWIRRDGMMIIARRVRAAEVAVLADALIAIGLSDAVLTTEPPDTVAEVLLSEAAVGEKKHTRASRAVHTIALCDSALAPSGDVSRASALFLDQPKMSGILLRELLKGNASGYYFLPNIDPHAEHVGYVAILRQVFHLPRIAADALVRGATRNELVDLLGNHQFSGLKLDRLTTEISMPVGQVASPYLEHIMQSFATMFARIGVSDISDLFLEHILSSCTSTEPT